ncbi:MobC family plasmid mobilization relaxosome protein (plasmid) [Alicyclobacillus fastidiosus]|uniref:MobC family plasmid mobilization relaxosome protein n=1 Tax=Alicyclobacillus fastidiosus TaxID=392011 RepID=A0ABY6ZPQ9_9BACL|nr:plasmid mobilization relaxosome protein MobC [Alicyclobacillus fastidiosus]WAH44968.1 MobC family plasmid mobilization relaxosome protein [Alicyclobacillus fastidiosus]GMA66214.1 hypothetical protein GCM10025859_66560 [Alicyclobacillus fastidiosus]GMA66248.1 hypothetical protein GCM10025859_66900 [Alicyclobacillus fastidiosus]
MGSENRKRQRMVPIRLSDEEFERLERKADKVGLTVPAFLRELAIRQRVKSPVIDRDGAVEIGKQIRAIGNNLNQLTRLSHDGTIEVVELKETRQELHEVWRLLNSVLQATQTVSSTTAREKQKNETE